MQAPKVVVSPSSLEHFHERFRPSWVLYAGGSGTLCYLLGFRSTNMSWLATWSASMMTKRTFILPNAVFAFGITDPDWPEISYIYSLYFTFCLWFAFGLSQLWYFSQGGFSPLTCLIISSMFYSTEQLADFLFCLLKLRLPLEPKLKWLLSDSLLPPYIVGLWFMSYHSALKKKIFLGWEPFILFLLSGATVNIVSLEDETFPLSILIIL